MKKSYVFENLDCAHCAEELKEKIGQVEGVHSVSVEYPSCKAEIDMEEGLEEKIRAVVAREEPGVIIREVHSDHEEGMATYMFKVEDIDCANCAASLESKIAKLEGISNVRLNFMKSTLQYDCAHSEGSAMREKVEALIAKEEPDCKVTFTGHKHHHTHEEHAHHEHCACSEHDHEEEMATYMFKVEDIDCANCAASLESKIAKLEGISNVRLNFMKSTLQYDCAHSEGSAMREKVEALIAKEEPDCRVTFTGHKHHHSHEEEPHAETVMASTANTHKYRIEGIDCADCAAKLEGKLSGIEGISRVSISFMNSTLQYDCDPSQSERIEKEVEKIAHREEPDTVISELHEDRKEIQEEEKEDHLMLYRLIVGAILFGMAMVLKGNVQAVIATIAYVILGYDVVLKAFKGIGRGQLFDEHFLMTVATFAAIYLGDLDEACGVMLFYQIGEYFQDMAVAKSRKSIGELMDIRPEYAVVNRNNDWIRVNPEDVRIGEVVRVKPGERVPLDGSIVKGSSSLNTASLTGESKPRDVDVNDEVISGSVNETGVLEIRVAKEYGDSTVARILDLVENQDSRKASAENFITKFSRVYTPTVVFSAIAVAIVVGLLGKGWNTAVYRACTFLVISCPCALVISIPLSFFAGIGGLSSRGVLVKGANLIEALAKVQVIVMDKTGTLTSGKFAVEEKYGENTEKVLEHAAYAENYSNHPIAVGIKEAYGKSIEESRVSEVKEIAGRGVRVILDGKEVLAGNYKLMKEYQIACEERQDTGTLVYVAREGKYEGVLVLRDQLKEDAVEAVAQLHKEGKKVYIVSGDNQQITDEIAAKLHADKAYGGCLPEDKVAHLQKLRGNAVTAFVGDGVNDAPVITSADTGIAMGALGADAAIEAADVVIMDDKPSKIALAISSAKRILRVSNENIYFAIFVKIATLILGAFGIANMWMAIFADTGVAMLCVLNSLRLLHIARK